MPRPAPAVTIHATPTFDFMSGKYDLSGWRIPYFATTMTFRDAAANLMLVHDFPNVDRLNWRLDELYQRDLNWTRIQRQILPYLRNSVKPQFFNSITVALLPYRASQVTNSFVDGAFHPPGFQQPTDLAKTLDVGPISLGYWNTWSSVDDSGAKLGQVRWNPLEVFSAAIDGQHRLAAIKLFCDEQRAGDRVDTSTLPVILLILDERVGYKKMGTAHMVDVLRTLFIDLNKHAEPVLRSRQIILDDKDPHSLCVRRLVGEKLKNDLSDLELNPPRLPLTLVEWHTDKGKFDEGPYLATILGLDWIVTRALGSKPIRDFMDYNSIRRQLGGFRTSLGVDLSDAESRITDAEETQMQPFAYREDETASELSAITNAFAKVWNPGLIRVFTEFAPYKLFIEKRQSSNTLRTDFVTWYDLLKEKEQDPFEGRATGDYRRFLGELAQRDENPIGEQALETKLQEINRFKEGNLAFKVVFQRALFDAYVQFTAIEDLGFVTATEDEDLEFLDEEEDEEEDQPVADETPAAETEIDEPSLIDQKAQLRAVRTTEFLSALNAMIEGAPAFLDVECAFEMSGDEEAPFWLGTLYTAEGNIDFTMAASIRAKDIILWICYAHLLHSREDEILHDGFDSFLEQLEEGDLVIYKRFRSCLKRFASESGAAGRILKSRDEDYNEDKAAEEVNWRLKWIFKKLGIPCD